MALPTGSGEREVFFATASREGAVLVGWMQAQAVGQRAGMPWVALVGADGELLMDPRPLPIPRPEPDVSATLRWMDARWDFGRFVVTGQLNRDGVHWSWVLEPDGRDSWNGPGRVVCPISGCMRVELAVVTGSEPQVLRLAPLDESVAGVNTGIVANDAQALSVSDDRLLVLHSPLDGVGGCTVHVYDVGHRVVAHESASSSLRCAPGSVVPTPAGFSLLEVEGSSPSRGLAVQTLTCGDDT